MNKLKVVHIEDYFDPKAGYQINELIKYNQEIEHTVICSFDMTPFYKDYSALDDTLCEKENHIKIIRLKTRFKYSQRVWLKNWLNTIEELEPDILFMHGIGDFKDLLLLLRKREYVVVRDCHMSWVASRNKFASIYFKIYRSIFASIINNSTKYKKIYALGIEEKQYLYKLGVAENKIDMMPHGYNPNMFYYSQKERDLIRKQLKISEDEVLVSYIGKFDKFKKPDLIFDCINNLDEELLKANKIVLLFMGSQKEEYMNDTFYIKQKKLKKDIHIILKKAISVDSIRAYYCATDICIWPRETTLSSIHAQACGTTVIMEAQESNIERVVNKDNLYKINDLNDASSKLMNCIRNKKTFDQKLMLDNENRNNSILFNSISKQWKIFCDTKD